MQLLSDCNWFEPYKDPQSVVVTYVLSQRVADVQQSFYFVNNPLSRDGRWLWFYCANPPSADAAFGRTLGVLDLQEAQIRTFPTTQFYDASPYVDPVTGEAVWCTRKALWTISPDAGSQPRLIGELPDELVGSRPVGRLATHLTLTMDGRAFLIDAEVGTGWFTGMMDRRSGTFELWERFDTCFNHGQCSPTDPDLVLLARDFWFDPATGQIRWIKDDRIWLQRRGEPARRLFDRPTPGTHEWWDNDGRHVWYIDGSHGTCRVNIETREVEVVWPGGRWHSQVDPTGIYLAGDYFYEPFYRGAPSRVSFFNRSTGRQVDIIVRNPEAPLLSRNYHIDPHPQFIADGRYILHTTTVRGAVDVAITPVAQLIEKTAGEGS